MDSAGPEGGGRGRWSSPYSQPSCSCRELRCVGSHFPNQGLNPRPLHYKVDSNLWMTRKVDQGPCHWRPSRCFPRDQKASQVCRYFQRGFCFHGDGCSYQHLPSPRHLEWGCRHSEPHVTLPGPWLGLTRRGSEPSYLPSVAISWGCVGASPDMELGLEGLFSKAEDAGGSSQESLSLSKAEYHGACGVKPPNFRCWLHRFGTV